MLAGRTGQFRMNSAISFKSVIAWDFVHPLNSIFILRRLLCRCRNRRSLVHLECRGRSFLFFSFVIIDCGFEVGCRLVTIWALSSLRVK